MKITLTKEEIRNRLRLLAGLEPERSNCAVEYTDGTDLNGLLDARLRAWYLTLLSEGDMSLLAPSDTAAAVRCAEGPAGGSAVSLPVMCRRVADIRLSGWRRSCAVLPAADCDTTVRRQSNPFLRATVDSPVAVVAPGGAGGAVGGILAWPAGEKAELLTAVLDTGPESFTFDETALAGLDKLVETLNII